jgi:sterol desaturase/sphingolipid hydroxylase (fatty acid hydroxylase superfamily)
MDDPQMPPRMKIGEGRISGAVSIAFGAIALGGVLCFHFPELLTTPEFRAQYDVEVLRGILLGCIFVAYACALRSLIANASKRAGLVGGALATASLLLGGAGVEVEAVRERGFYLSLDWLLLDLIAMALVFVPLELFFPKRADQTRFHPEWRTDLAYFVMAHLFVQGIAAMSERPVRLFLTGFADHLDTLRDTVGGLPFALQLFLALLTTDLFQYALHRTFHAVPLLWRFHAVHHSTRAMDWLAGSRQHVVDVVGTRIFVYLPLFVLGFSPGVFYTYVGIVAIHAVLNHTNVRLRYGPLEWLIVSPRIHHWHHAHDPAAYDKNFCVHFSWIDRLFGTYYAPGDEWPERTGLDDAAFPKGFLAQQVDPFIRDPFAGDPTGPRSTR